MDLNWMELVALLANSGLVLVLVQVIKIKLLPVLKEKFPWSLPMIASALGFATAIILSLTGIDISPIVGVFSGLAASGAFAIFKEATN